MFSDYVRHGWSICGIDTGSKSPRYDGWPTNAIPLDAADGLDGAGLLHVQSKTACLDIDDMPRAKAWLAERGVDLAALLAADDAVQITSGRPGRAKLLYRMSRPLRTLKPKGHGVELRCATSDGKSMQDVLPPSVHPDTGKPYEWRFGLLADWRDLPPVPAQLLACWRAEAAPVTVPAGTQKPTGEAPSALAKLLKGKTPNIDYDAWLKVGMALHHETSGSSEGLAVWDEWSSTGEKYKGIEDLRGHWNSFQSGEGKRVVTAASLKVDQVADAEDFEAVPTEEIAKGAEKVETATVKKKLNRKEAVDFLQSRLVYIRQAEKYFDIKDHMLVATESGLEHIYTPFMPKSGNVRVSPSRMLKEMQDKITVYGIGFDPGADAVFTYEDKRYANAFDPYVVAPIEPMKDELDKINWLFGRIEDPIFRKYLIQFYAHVVQHPGVKINSAPLIWSPTTGNGKTTLLKVVPSLLVGGRHSCEVSCDLLNSGFNDYLQQAWHVNLPEFRAGTRGERAAIASKLKSWIADPAVSMHPKGQRGYTMPNHFFITASSNEDDAAQLDNEDRRWAVHEMKAKQFTEAEQRWIYDQFLHTPRAAAVLRHYFLSVDLSDFQPSAKAPETQARQDMIAASGRSDYLASTEMFDSREPPFDRDIVTAGEVASALKGRTAFIPNNIVLGRMLQRSPFGGVGRKVRLPGGGTKNFIILRNKAKWMEAPGSEILKYFEGENISSESVDDDELLN